MAERAVAHHQEQHLDEARIGRAALDLGDGQLDVLGRHQDRRAQPRLTIEPFAGDPTVHRLAQSRRHVGVVERHRAVQHIGDGEAGAESIERIAAQDSEVGSRHALFRSPVRPRRLRQILRVACEHERRVVDIALGQMLAPEIVEIRHQRRDVGHGGMQVAIDCAGKGKLHRTPLGRGLITPANIRRTAFEHQSGIAA